VINYIHAIVGYEDIVRIPHTPGPYVELLAILT